MHLDVGLLTALGVFLHLGAGLAASLLRSQTDRAKIDRLSAGVDQVLGVVTAVAGALNAAQAAQTAQNTQNVQNGGTTNAG